MNFSTGPILLQLPQTGALVAQHYRDGRPMRISWDQFGLLTSIEPADIPPAEDLWVAPGLFDVQVNGYAGVDLQRERSVTEDTLLALVRGLRRDGCPRVLLTLITSEWESLLQRIQRYRRLIQGHDELKRAIVGWHIEGPFLSEEPGYKGAHNPVWMKDPSSTHIKELRRVTESDPVLLTLAPERMGSDSAIADAVRCGFVVSLGHTGASATQVKSAVLNGARGFTHLGNGCPQQLDRRDNILWTILNENALTAGIIPDGIHVSPPLFQIMHRAMDSRRIYWTTDAMSAAGAPPGRYTIGEIETTVGADGIVRNPATNSFAGSALTPIEGIRRGATMLNRRWQDVWDFFSTLPRN